MIWRRGNSKAFTLIELVVVIAIIAILSMIVTASTIAVLRNTQRKSMETTLSNYWRLTEMYFNQINKGMSTSGAPQREALGTRLNMRYSYIILKTTPCQSCSNNYLHIQYADNPKSSISRYSIVKMTYRYKGTYYKTEDGQNVTYSTDAP